MLNSYITKTITTTYLSQVLFVRPTSDYKSYQVQPKYKAHSWKNYKVPSFSQPFEFCPNFVEVDGIWCNENVSTERWEMSAQTVQLPTSMFPSNL